jgi:hypothetical protein
LISDKITTHEYMLLTSAYCTTMMIVEFKVMSDLGSS